METEIKEEQPAMLPSCKADIKSKLQKYMEKYSPIIVKRQSRASLPLSFLLDTASLVGLVFNSLSNKARSTGVFYVANSEVLTHVCCVCSRGFLVSSLETIWWQNWLSCAKSNRVALSNYKTVIWVKSGSKSNIISGGTTTPFEYGNHPRTLKYNI